MSNFNHKVVDANINIIKEKRRVIYQLLIWIILMSILVLGWVINSNITKLVVILLTSLFYITVKADVKFYMLLFCLPYIKFIRIGNEGFSTFNVWLVILLINLLLYKPKVKSLQLILFIALISVVSINLNNMAITTYLAWILNVLIVFFVCGCDYPTNKFSFSIVKSVLFLCSGFLSSSILGYLIRIFMPGKIEFFKTLTAITGQLDIMIMRFTGLMHDPNYFAQGILLCIASLFVLLINYQGISNKEVIGILCLLVSLIIFGLISYSKMYVLTLLLLLTVCITYIFITNKVRTIIRFIIVCFLLLMLFFAINSLFMKDILDIILYRFNNSSDLSTGRLTILENAIDVVLQQPGILLFGVGIGSSIVQYFGSALHNVYFESVMSFGIIGSIFWCMFLYSIYSNKKIIKNTDLISFTRYLPAAIIFITGFSLDGIWADWYYFYLVFSINVMKMEFNQTS